jgi:hypothetical protein
MKKATSYLTKVGTMMDMALGEQTLKMLLSIFMKLASTTGAGVAGMVQDGADFTVLGMEATMVGVVIGVGIIPGASTTGAGEVTMVGMLAGAGVAITDLDITVTDITAMATITMV